MSYKNLNAYKLAYKTAIDLHLYLEGKEHKVAEAHKKEIKELSRDILGNLAEATTQRTPKAQRFFNFKARDCVHRMLMDIEFFKDVREISADVYEKFQEPYSKLSNMIWKLNQEVLEKEKA